MEECVCVWQSMRLLDIPPCGRSMEQYLMMFVDQQDQGPVLLTPLYLLVGCALPLWLFPFNKGQSKVKVMRLS